MSAQLDINGPVATITLRRPQQASRLKEEDLDVLGSHIYAIHTMCLCSVSNPLAGSFAAGSTSTRLVQPVLWRLMNWSTRWRMPASSPLPLLKAVYEGATDLAPAYDFRIGATEADMFMPAAQLGLHFYQRGMERYVSRTGLDDAKRLFLDQCG